MGNDALSKFAPLMMPASLTQAANGMTSKEVPSNAIDLSLQTIFQVPHLSPAPESLMNFGNSLPQNQMLINQSAAPRGNTNGESVNFHFSQVPLVSQGVKMRGQNPRP